MLNRLSKQGVAILFSTHVLEIAEAICHHVSIMNEGSKLAEGSMRDLRVKAGLPGSSLEDIFLRLTKSENAADIVEALRL